MDVHVGRQPVFDRTGRVVGHELLFRDGDVSYARTASGASASAQALLSSYLDIGLDTLVGDGLAFVHLPRAFVTGQVPLPRDTRQLVLEVPADVGADEQLQAGVRRLTAEGRRVALDDFVWTGQTAALLPDVDLVKIDVRQHGGDVPELVRRCRDAGVEVVAEVETVEQLRTCRELSVEYYQGSLLQRPDALRTTSLSPRQVTCLTLVAALQKPEVSVDELVSLVRRDAGLTYRLLRAANGAALGLTRRVTALREALLLLGFGQLRRWAVLMLAADLPDEAGAGVEAAFMRAAMCERLADQAAADPEEAFVVGLLSSLPDLLGQPLDEILALLPLAAQTEAAVLQREGPLGEVLSCVLSYEQGVLVVPAASGLPARAPREAFLGAVTATLANRALLPAG